MNGYHKFTAPMRRHFKAGVDLSYCRPFDDALEELVKILTSDRVELALHRALEQHKSACEALSDVVREAFEDDFIQSRK